MIVSPLDRFEGVLYMCYKGLDVTARKKKVVIKVKYRYIMKLSLRISG